MVFFVVILASIILTNKKLKYMKKRKLILLILTIFLCAITYAQEMTISGHVKDKDGNPMPGVNVVFKVQQMV